MSNIAMRNRQNAHASTGPQTVGGKALARRNALRHGLTANPAAGVVEHPGRFNALLRQVDDALRPRNVIEAGISHRIAVAIWRLQRAAVADAAISSLVVRDAPLGHHVVQDWIEQIVECWKVEIREVTDREVLRKLREDGRLKPGERKWEEVRSGLRRLDDLRKDEIIQSGAGITALLGLLEELTSQLFDDPGFFGQVKCEQLSWLLGDGAYMFPTDGRLFLRPDEYPHPSSTQRLIGIARKRKPGTPIPPRLMGLIEAQVTSLRAQRRLIDDSDDETDTYRRRCAALLPDEATLNRLVRYEAHAERSLMRCLETMAKLRGATVETLSASLRGITADGTEVEIRGERTSWKPGEPVAGEG